MKQAFFPKAALAAAIFAASAGSQAAMQFTVDEVPFGGAGTVDGEVFNGRYVEVISFTSATTFAARGVARFGEIFESPLGLSSVGDIGSAYAIYAEFTLAGSFVPGTGFLGNTGAVTLYMDDADDTTFAPGATAADPFTFGNTADDGVLGTATLNSFFSIAAGGPLVTGSYDAVFDELTLTPLGESYFIAPTPFHMRTTVDGDYDNINLAEPNQVVGGDVSAIFVPEPGTVALMGIGLLGAGASMRRRNAA